MAGPANPHSMTPSQPGRTRTAPPQRPGTWPSQARTRLYLLFGATGFFYLLAGMVALRVLWTLGEGPTAWEALMTSLAHPVYIAFHVVSLIAVLFVGVRFFRLFPKSQPARIGPAKPPPGPVILALLYAAWVGVTLLYGAILAGGLF
jgi:fumarate reductase subunit C